MVVGLAVEEVELLIVDDEPLDDEELIEDVKPLIEDEELVVADVVDVVVVLVDVDVALDDEKLLDILEDDEPDVETVELLAVLDETVIVDEMLELLELETGAYIAARFGSLHR